MSARCNVPRRASTAELAIDLRPRAESCKDPRLHGGLREQFQVYCHEFARTPSIEFRLGLADVVFFGLLETVAEPDGLGVVPAP